MNHARRFVYTPPTQARQFNTGVETAMPIAAGPVERTAPGPELLAVAVLSVVAIIVLWWFYRRAAEHAQQLRRILEQLRDERAARERGFRDIKARIDELRDERAARERGFRDIRAGIGELRDELAIIYQARRTPQTGAPAENRASVATPGRVEPPSAAQARAADELNRAPSAPSGPPRNASTESLAAAAARAASEGGSTTSRWSLLEIETEDRGIPEHREDERQ